MNKVFKKFNGLFSNELVKLVVHFYSNLNWLTLTIDKIPLIQACGRSLGFRSS